MKEQGREVCLSLEALAGCLKGQVWQVGPAGATLGRASDNNLSLADKEMSRRHSKVCDLILIGPSGCYRALCIDVVLRQYGSIGKK